MVAAMKTITITVDDETYRLLQRRAVERDDSLASMAREMLTSEIKRSEERALRKSVGSFSANDRLLRDELYERHS